MEQAPKDRQIVSSNNSYRRRPLIAAVLDLVGEDVVPLDDKPGVEVLWLGGPAVLPPLVLPEDTLEGEGRETESHQERDMTRDRQHGQEQSERSWLGGQ